MYFECVSAHIGQFYTMAELIIVDVDHVLTVRTDKMMMAIRYRVETRPGAA